MNTAIEWQIRQQFYTMAEESYRDFQAKLMPTMEKHRIFGIRTPILRAFANEFYQTEDSEAFLHALPHESYEENNLHALLLMKIRDIKRLEPELDAFLPHIDNWATCDMLSLKILKTYPETRMRLAKKYLADNHTYTIRFGIGILMRYELDDPFTPTIPELAASLHSEEYYVKMMQAWFFATALAKQYDAVLPYLTERKLDPWVHNKTIRKAIESDRIPLDHKNFLRTLSLRS